MEEWDVLVVDDSEDWRTFLKYPLEQAGLRCASAASYDTALDFLQKALPAALVLDLDLHDSRPSSTWEGWELAQRAIDLDISSVIVSSHSGDLVINRAYREFAAVAFYRKEKYVDQRSQFVSSVREAIETTRKRRAARLPLAGKRVTLLIKGQDALRVMWRSELMGDIDASFYHPLPTAAINLILQLITSNRVDLHSLSEEEKAVLSNTRIQPDLEIEADLLDRLGMALYDSLTPGRAGSALEMELNQVAKEDGYAFRLALAFDSSSTDLARYPWELIHDSRRFLANGRIALSRYIMCPEPIPTLDINRPLRFLVLCPRPYEVAPLPECEIERIKSHLNINGVGSVLQFDVVEPPTFERLKSMLSAGHRRGTPYHGLFYDGHGAWGWICDHCKQHNEVDSMLCRNCDAERPNNAKILNLLFLEAKDTRAPDAIDARRFAAALTGKGIKLVLMSACLTAQVRGSTIFNTFGPRLIQEGIPAVVGMQFPISTQDTIAFFEEFFTALGSSGRLNAATIEDAVRDARLMIDNRWFCPVLYLRARDDGQTW